MDIEKYFMIYRANYKIFKSVNKMKIIILSRKYIFVSYLLNIENTSWNMQKRDYVPKNRKEYKFGFQKPEKHETFFFSFFFLFLPSFTLSLSLPDQLFPSLVQPPIGPDLATTSSNQPSSTDPRPHRRWTSSKTASDIANQLTPIVRSARSTWPCPGECQPRTKCPKHARWPRHEPSMPRPVQARPVAAHAFSHRLTS